MRGMKDKHISSMLIFRWIMGLDAVILILFLMRGFLCLNLP